MLRAGIATGGVTALLLTCLAAEEPTIVTTIRAVTSAPERYSNRPVRLTGRFGGRVVAPPERSVRPPKRTRWDFLLKWDDAAVWVSGLRPVGRDFDLDPLSAADARAGRWLDVTGTVRVKNRAERTSCAAARCTEIWIEATDMHLAAPPWGILLQAVLQPRAAAPQIVFNDPIADEVGVARSTPVRIQFSRAMNGESFSGRVRVSYASPRALGASPVPPFTAVYQADTRGLELRFTALLHPMEIVKVEVLEGVAAADGHKLAPWTLTFRTGAD
jgi:Bacterial Ig-like domain